MLLSVLVVTRNEPHVYSFLLAMRLIACACKGELVIAADGAEAEEDLKSFTKDWEETRVIRVNSQGFIESCLEVAVRECEGAYILRLDDDEKASPAMMDWLVAERYISDSHWKFPRAAMISETHYISNPPLWPDVQTRLSIKSLSGGRHTIHAGSPYGGGKEAPVAIEHHKFLVKTYEQRVEIADRYDRIMMGAGRNGMAAFQLPEDVFGEELTKVELGLGYVDQLSEAR